MKKELLILAAIVLAAFLLTIALFGFDNLTSDATFEVSIYNTNFGISSQYIILGFMALLTTGAYFVRILFERFQNQFANVAFLVFNTALIICILLVCDALYALEDVIREKMAKTTTQEMTTSTNKVVANLIESAYFMIALAIFVKLLVIFKMRNAQKTNS